MLQVLPHYHAYRMLQESALLAQGGFIAIKLKYPNLLMLQTFRVPEAGSSICNITSASSCNTLVDTIVLASPKFSDPREHFCKSSNGV